MKKLSFDLFRKSAFSHPYLTSQSSVVRITASQKVFTPSFISQSRRQFSMNGPFNGNTGKSNVACDQSEAAAMNEAKEFLKQTKEFIDEVNDHSEWMSKVMLSEKPVILDCYAEWCAPCRKLTPQLEQLTIENEGKFKLVKLNIDTVPQIATGLKIKSIPAVFLVHKGNILDTFVGIPKQDQLKEFINTALLLESISSDESVIKTLIEKAEEFITNNKLEEAEKMYIEGYSYENWRNQFGPQFVIGLAYCQLFNNSELKRCQETLLKVTEPQKKNLPEFYKQLLIQIENEITSRQSASKPTEEELKMIEKIDQDPSDLQTRYDLAKLQLEKGKFEEAIESCMQILQIQRNWNNKAAHNLLMEIFNKVGSSNELVVKARKRLSRILF